MLQREYIAQGDGWRLGILEQEDIPGLQELLESCADYYELVTGLLPGPSEGHSLYICLPEGCNYGQKLLLGVETTTGRLIGVLDAVRDYPEPHKWFLGLFIIEPDERNKGLGAVVYSAFEQWAISNGAKTIALGVASHNTRASAFWQSVGYASTGTMRTITLDSLENRIVVMEKSLM